MARMFNVVQYSSYVFENIRSAKDYGRNTVVRFLVVIPSAVLKFCNSVCAMRETNTIGESEINRPSLDTR